MLAIAGGLAGAPLPLVKAETVDLEVPADAEIVIEGLIHTEALEPEGSFGESHGYSDPRTLSPYFEVTAITHRRQPIYQGIISEFPPSESTVMRKAAFDAIYLRHVRDACNIPCVTKVACHEMANAYSELNDPVDQLARFREQAALLARGDEEAHWLDEDYVRALEYGMPPAAGEGIGIDRLLMMFANQPSIREVILFPLLRPEGGRATDEDKASQ